MRHLCPIRAGFPVAAAAVITLLGTLGCASPPERVASPEAPPATTATAVPAGAPASSAKARAPETLDADDAKPEPVAIAGSDLVHGRTKVVVKLPIQKVREAVLDFQHYAEFMPHYRTCKVLGRTAEGAREIYMEVEALNGMVRMWAQIEMPKPTVVDGVETHESKFVKGNVKDFKAIWRLKKVDEKTTELSLEVFLEPSLPMPSGLVNNENLKGSAHGVVAMRAHAEKM